MNIELEWWQYVSRENPFGMRMTHSRHWLTISLFCVCWWFWGVQKLQVNNFESDQSFIHFPSIHGDVRFVYDDKPSTTHKTTCTRTHT